MTNTLIDVKEALHNCIDDGYLYLLAVSSDSLYVLSPNRDRIVETVIKGKDNDGYVLSADCEDSFLDAISVIKRYILSGINPIDILCV